MIKKGFLFQKNNMSIKNTEIHADFESAGKVVKNVCEKSYQQKSDKKWSLLLLLLSAHFFGEFVFTIVNGFELSFEICVYNNHIKIFSTNLIC
jgi:hypothetical protein